MVRIIRFHEFGGPEVLRIENTDVAPPGRGEVQIRVKALGLNRAEANLRRGAYIETPKLPSSLGLEAAGLIERVGVSVDEFSPGDAVSVIPPISMLRWPTYSEIANFPAELVVKHPGSLEFTQAAAVWMQYLTAYGALIDICRLERGDRVVITAASSSVGIAAIQTANMVGAMPIAVTRTTAKADALSRLGAAHVIVLAEDVLERKIEEITDGRGARVVFDAVGGPIFGPLTRAMSPGGILIEYGGLSGEPTPFPLPEVLAKSLILRGYLVHHVTANKARLEAAKRFICGGLDSGALLPIIAETFPFEQIIEAHRFLESNQQFGKIVVTI